RWAGRPLRRDRSGRRWHHLRIRRLGLLRGWFEGIRFADFLFETLQSFPHAFADLRQFSGSEDNEHDDEDEDKLGDSERPKHTVTVPACFNSCQGRKAPIRGRILSADSPGVLALSQGRADLFAL